MLNVFNDRIIIGARKGTGVHCSYPILRIIFFQSENYGQILSSDSFKVVSLSAVTRPIFSVCKDLFMCFIPRDVFFLPHNGPKCVLAARFRPNPGRKMKI